MASLVPFNTVLLYPGRCTMFNMVRVKRISKKKEAEEDNVSQLWEIEDEDDYLIVRVLFTSHPWLIVHHGVNEIVKAPLVLFIDDEDLNGAKISLTLRDSANRGHSCIKRRFIFEFQTGTDARVFKTSHNLTLQDHSNRLVSCDKEIVSHQDFMKERFEKGDENNMEDDNNEETQNPWDDDDYVL